MRREGGVGRSMAATPPRQHTCSYGSKTLMERERDGLLNLSANTYERMLPPSFQKIVGRWLSPSIAPLHPHPHVVYLQGTTMNAHSTTT